MKKEGRKEREERRTFFAELLTIFKHRGSCGLQVKPKTQGYERMAPDGET